MNHSNPTALYGSFQAADLLAGQRALPWIVFVRDRLKFEKEFPEWQIELIQPMMPFRYLLSGGVSLCTLAPTWNFGLWTQIESVLSAWKESTSHVCAWLRFGVWIIWPEHPRSLFGASLLVASLPVQPPHRVQQPHRSAAPPRRSGSLRQSRQARYHSAALGGVARGRDVRWRDGLY